MPQRLFGSGERERIPDSCVGQDERLLPDVDLIDIRPVDYQTFPDADKHGSLRFHLPLQDLLEMGKVEREQVLRLVVQHHHRIIAIR